MILVTGATGNNGLEIVKLLSRTGVRCRALVRSIEKSGALANLPGVRLVYGDFADPDALAPALEGIDRALLISSIDPRLPELQGNFIRAAKRAGVRYVVKFSGMDANVHSEWRFLRWHAEAEKELENSGLAVAVAVITGTGHEGKTYVITGPEALTYADVAEKLSAAVGKDVTYVDVPLEKAKQAILDGGAPEWFAEGQMEQFRFRWQGKQSRVTSTIADVAKKEPTTFLDFAREFAPYFRGEKNAAAMAAHLPSGR